MPTVQSYSTDPAFALEQAIARKLGVLKARVDLFASSFDDQGKPTQKAQVRVGWSGSQYKTIARTEEAVFSQETARFEIEVEVVDLKSHSSAMRYIRQATAILCGFKPFAEINALEPVNSGDPRFNKADRSWLYTAIMSAQWNLVNGELEVTPIEDLPEITDVIVKVARFMPPDYEETIVDQFGGA